MEKNEIIKLKDEVWAKYQNEFYGLNLLVEKRQGGRIKLRTFSAIELRILMAVIHEVDEKYDKVVLIPIKRVRELVLFQYGNVRRLKEIMDGAQEALANLKFRGKSCVASGTVNVFEYALANYKRGIECQVSKTALPLFNDLFSEGNGGYSQIMLSMVNHLNKYEIMLAMRLVHYRNIVDDQTRKHVYRTRLEDFMWWMNIPDAYDFRRTNNNIIQPAICNLRKYFLGLNMEKIRTGKKVTGLAFWYDAINDTGADLIVANDAEPFDDKPKLPHKEEHYGPEWDGPFGTFSNNGNGPV